MLKYVFHVKQSVTKHKQIFFSFASYAGMFSLCYVSRETITANCNLYFPTGLSYICDIFPMV